MNDQADVDAILGRFRQWLDSARAECETDGTVESCPGSEQENDQEFGIIDLVKEFTALRQEVKLQTKSNRGLSEQTDSTLAALREAIEQFRSVEPKEAHAVWAAGKALAKGLADLDEAIDRGHREIERAREQIAEESPRALETALDQLHRGQSWIRRRLLRTYHNHVLEIVRHVGLSRHELFDSFQEGYGLIQKRLRRVMASEQVNRIACEGRIVDPELMTVLEVVDQPGQERGTVIKELRKGYTWRGRVIRYAEVQAVRGLASTDMAGSTTSSECENHDGELETDN